MRPEGEGMFVLSSEITIGKFKFTGVHEVRIRRSLHGLADTAIITIPSIAKILRGGVAFPGTITTANQFNDGDAVEIKLGYNGYLRSEFSGFVRHRSLQMPLEVHCEGYSWLLRRTSNARFYKADKVKALLEEAVSGLGPGNEIAVECDLNLKLGKVNGDGDSSFDLLTNIKKYTDECLTCFFVEPNKLWCGLLYTAWAKGEDALKAGTVKYSIGENVRRDQQLQVKHNENDRVEVRYSKKLPNGNVIAQRSDILKKHLRRHKKIINRVLVEGDLKALANEKAYQLNNLGFEGSLTGFLEPFALPGYNAQILDKRFPEHNGEYLVESTEVVFGMGGARRIVELGPRKGFAKEL